MDYTYDLPDKEARMWAMWCHLAAIAGYTGIPFANIIGPFIVWMIKRDTDPFVDYHGKESLNFQISVTIYLVISAFLVLVLIGILFLIVIPIAALILTIIATIKANDGDDYRYPCTIRLIG